MALRCRALGKLSTYLSYDQLLRLQQRNSAECDILQQVSSILGANAVNLFHYFKDIDDVLENFYVSLNSLELYCEGFFLQPVQYSRGNLSQLTDLSYQGDGFVFLDLLRRCICYNNKNDFLRSLRFRIYSSTPLTVQNQLLYFHLNRSGLLRLDARLCLNRFTLNALSYYMELEYLKLEITQSENQLTSLPELQNLKEFVILKQDISVCEIVEVLAAFENLKSLEINAGLIQHADLDFTRLESPLEDDSGVFESHISRHKRRMFDIFNRPGSLEILNLNVMSKVSVDVLYILFVEEPRLSSITLRCEVAPSLFTERNFQMLEVPYNCCEAPDPCSGQKPPFQVPSEFDLTRFNAEYREFEGGGDDFGVNSVRSLVSRQSFQHKCVNGVFLPFYPKSLDICCRTQSDRLFSITELSDSSEQSSSDSSGGGLSSSSGSENSGEGGSETAHVGDDAEKSKYAGIHDWKYEDNIELNMEDYIELGRSGSRQEQEIDYNFDNVHLHRRNKSGCNSIEVKPELARSKSEGNEIASNFQCPARKKQQNSSLLESEPQLFLTLEAGYLTHLLGDFNQQEIHNALLNGNDGVKEYFASMGKIPYEDSQDNESEESENDINLLEYDSAVLFLAFILPASTKHLDVPFVDFSQEAFSIIMQRCHGIRWLKVLDIPEVAICIPATNIYHLDVIDQGVMSASELHILFPHLAELCISNLIAHRFTGTFPLNLQSLHISDSPYILKGVLENIVQYSKDSLSHISFKNTPMPTLLFQIPLLECATFQSVRSCVVASEKHFATLQVHAFCTINRQLGFLDYSSSLLLCTQPIKDKEACLVINASQRLPCTLCASLCLNNGECAIQANKFK